MGMLSGLLVFEYGGGVARGGVDPVSAEFFRSVSIDDVAVSAGVDGA
jgi:hypothetical protein